MTKSFCKNFNAIILLYFAAHTVIRSCVGGNLERDEAEMIIMAQGFHLGYGPQLPLYNWLQAISFCLFGTNTFALTIVKNLLLATFYIALFDALKRLLPDRLALFGTLGAFLLPNMFWESQRAGTHSIALFATMAICLNILSRLIVRPKKGHWAALGLAIAAGGLSKYNFWLFAGTLGLGALSIRHLRSAIFRPQMVLSIAIASLLLAAPYFWSVTHPNLSLASSHKLHSPEAGPFAGLLAFSEQSFLALIFPVIVLGMARVITRVPAHSTQNSPFPAGQIVQWLLLTGLIGMAVSGSLASALNTQSFQARWLLPSYIPISIAMFIWALGKSGERAEAFILLVTVAVASLTLTAMAANRLSGTTGNALDMERLAKAIEDSAPKTQAITMFGKTYFYTGNLALIRPDWDAPSPGTAPLKAPHNFVLMETQNDEDARTLLTSMGFPTPIDLTGIRYYTASIPYRSSAKPPRLVPFALLER
ncbi:ArnT family glycosyltransferase [Celeribacter ethanolicus]|uniref:ArnT family glycosyltransferase n=1 Tax=Celeribacter ethanolicus TaxID=1758178 RepID=UPI00138F3CB3|nr:glycosyltransferase family 39 protein [Celeribacter ethanolicus]